MKAGKKLAAKAQHRSIMHNNAIIARNKKGISETAGFKAPGSMNKKKV